MEAAKLGQCASLFNIVSMLLIFSVACVRSMSEIFLTRIPGASLTSLLPGPDNKKLFCHRRTHKERFVASASSTAPVYGVAPLRAGQGSSFVLRRLHSLTGIIPVGAFLFEHILISNSTAISGPDAYARQVSFLANLPLVFFLELLFIWIPIAFHGLYGFYIWYRGDANTASYPWSGNWMYTMQRWTGGIAFVYIVWHTYTMRFSGTDLHDNPVTSFGKVAAEVHNPWLLALLPLSQFTGLVGHRLFERTPIDRQDAIFSLRATLSLNRMMLALLRGRYFLEVARAKASWRGQ
jgi:succinate dehydrogenase/fumarate reductase cytochrome b subunit